MLFNASDSTNSSSMTQPNSNSINIGCHVVHTSQLIHLIRSQNSRIHDTSLNVDDRQLLQVQEEVLVSLGILQPAVSALGSGLQHKHGAASLQGAAQGQLHHQHIPADTAHIAAVSAGSRGQTICETGTTRIQCVEHTVGNHRSYHATHMFSLLPVTCFSKEHCHAPPASRLLLGATDQPSGGMVHAPPELLVQAQSAQAQDASPKQFSQLSKPQQPSGRPSAIALLPGKNARCWKDCFHKFHNSTPCAHCGIEQHSMLSQAEQDPHEVTQTR